MAQLLAVDYGARRLGIAVSDPGGAFALPLDCLTLPPRARAAAVARMARDRQVDTIVVGRPVRAGGEDSALWPQIEGFGRALARRGFRVVYEDESFSSAAAQGRLAGTRPAAAARRAGQVDALAAQLILDQYLARNRPSDGG